MTTEIPSLEAIALRPLLEVRAPWPDELPRLTEAFPGLTLDRLWELRVLVVTAGAGTVERLVGLAALTARVEGKAEANLILAVRPRFANTAEAKQLLGEILAVGTLRGFASVAAAAVPDADHRSALLAQAGFRPVSNGSYWSLDTRI
jgi:hypothetical protein